MPTFGLKKYMQRASSSMKIRNVIFMFPHSVAQPCMRAKVCPFMACNRRASPAGAHHNSFVPLRKVEQLCKPFPVPRLCVMANLYPSKRSCPPPSIGAPSHDTCSVCPDRQTFIDQANASDSVSRVAATQSGFLPTVKRIFVCNVAPAHKI